MKLSRDDLDAFIEQARLRFACRECGGSWITDEESNNLMCRECGSRHCPFCGIEVPFPGEAGCPHFIITTGEVEWDGAGPEFDLPSFEESGPPGGEWQSNLARSLGDLDFLLPELEEYVSGEYPWTRYNEVTLMEKMLANARESIVSVWWGGWWMAATTGTDHFALNGAEALQQLSEDWERVEGALTTFAEKYHPEATKD